MLNGDGFLRGEPVPSVRLEHELRYRSAAPIITAAAVWCDLGCGAGTAAAAALDELPGRVVLVDRDDGAVQDAAARLGGAACVPVVADLTRADDVDRVRAAILATDGDRVVTCFATLERLETFVPVLDLLDDLVERHGATVVLSVPDDDVRPPAGDDERASVWGEGAFEELRRAFTVDAVVARQTAVAGSAVVPVAEGGDAALDAAVSVRPADSAPTHLLAAFGPRAGALAPAAAAAAFDAREDRARARWREARLEHDAAAVEELTAEVERLRSDRAR